MAIFFNKTQRSTNPSDKNAAMKWYPRVKSISLASEKEVAQLISDETTLNPKEAEMALAQLQKAVTILLKAGRNVRLGDWASFSVTVQAEGADTEEECTAQRIKKVVPHCRFSKEFQQSLQSATFQRGETMLKKSKTASSQGGSSQGGSQGGSIGITE